MALLGVVVVWGLLLWVMLNVWAWWGNGNVVEWNSKIFTILYGLGALLENPPHRPPSNISSQVRTQRKRRFLISKKNITEKK